ncbi:hypothetical protein NDU88_005808 [Pleurodeles waltl]|uniref:Uncharacterized protein n=1 Tax=Pleurodeles waltl TaxID=8319 RepID=A0AAV7SMU2_PLEWA|nr:hypothetical protein NDU88_005808 [Pleurodeles waltl]
MLFNGGTKMLQTESRRSVPENQRLDKEERHPLDIGRLLAGFPKTRGLRLQGYIWASGIFIRSGRSQGGSVDLGCRSRRDGQEGVNWGGLKVGFAWGPSLASGPPEPRQWIQLAGPCYYESLQNRNFRLASHVPCGEYRF